MNLDEAAVRQALHSLDGQSLVRSVSASDSRVTKYEHRLQETFNFYRHEIAILCVLLLPRSADTRRTSHSHRTHAFLRRFERRAIQPQPFDEARAPARQSSSPATRHQGIPLRPSLVRRRGSLRAEVRSRSKSGHQFRRTPGASRSWRKRSPHFAAKLQIFKEKLPICANNSLSSKTI